MRSGVRLPQRSFPHESKSPEETPATEISEPQELELEDQIRLRAYELYEERGREDGHELGRLVPRERGDHASRNSEPPPPDLCTHSSQKVRQAPDRSGAFFMRRNFPIVQIANLRSAEYYLEGGSNLHA